MKDIDEFLRPLDIGDDELSLLTLELSKTFKYLAWYSGDQFLATPINVLPTGLETGRFLAIDVGGSNLRVAFIELLGENATSESKIRRTHQQCWPIEERVKNDRPVDLFAWIGDCIAQVVRACLAELAKGDVDSSPLGEELPMGITFSFPMIQKSISEATLMAMGKGFAITSDLDLGGLLLEGYFRHIDASRKPRLPKLKITAIANDSVATLATLAYSTGTKLSNSRTSLGLIMGTGANAALAIPRHYLPSSKLDPIMLPASEIEHPMIVTNTEFTLSGVGATLKASGLQTRWDEALDAAVETPGFQPFEYMTSGRYIGELVRLIFNSYLVELRNVDPGLLPEALQRRNGFPTMFLSDTAHFTDPKRWRKMLQSNFPASGASEAADVWSWTDGDAETVMKIAQAVQTRSSRLIASAVVGLLACAGELRLQGKENVNGVAVHPPQKLVVAYAGGVIESYPRYRETCQSAIDGLVEAYAPSADTKVVLKEAKDSGVVGAGILAGTVWHLDT